MRPDDPHFDAQLSPEENELRLRKSRLKSYRIAFDFVLFISTGVLVEILIGGWLGKILGGAAIFGAISVHTLLDDKEGSLTTALQEAQREEKARRKAERRAGRERIAGPPRPK